MGSDRRRTDRLLAVWERVSGRHRPLWEMRKRHYSYGIRGRKWEGALPKRGTIAGPGRTLCLMTPCGRAAFVWHYSLPGMRRDKVDGPMCALFRNEGAGQSSHLILAAEVWADHAIPEWRGLPRYTYVSPAHLPRGTNPGYCFLCAGWCRAGWSAGQRLLLLRKGPA